MKRNPVRDFVRTLAGTVLDFAYPSLGRDIASGEATGRNLRLKRLVLQARLGRARWRGDEAAVQATLHDFWQGDAPGNYYDRYADRFQRWFLGPHHEIVEALVAEVARRPYVRLVEIGCGDGRVLAHLAGSLPELGELVGLDINAAIIARTSAAHADDPRLTFRAGNALDLFDDHRGDGTILLTYGGVMEYFSGDELAGLFRRLAGHAGVAVALVEPVDPSHDLSNDTASHVFGAENSFSHNHCHLLEREGYTVRFRREMDLGGARWMLVIATRD